MKWYSIILMILISFIFNACSMKSTAEQENASTHLKGDKIDVRYYPLKTPVLKYFANHTYPEAFDKDENRHAWKALGGDSGGKVLSGTTTKCPQGSGCIDISTINYIMTEEPCIWPYKNYYAVVGVCWNATNRGLYYTGKTVHNIPHYVLIEKMYGTYGLDTNSKCWHNPQPRKCKDAKEKYAWSKCLKKVTNDMPWSVEKSNKLKSSTNQIDPRIELYDNYINNLQLKGAQDQEQIYLQKLFELNIKEKLGIIPADKKNKLLEIDKKYRENRSKTANTMAKSKDETFNQEEYLNNLNTLINDELGEYKEILTDKEYMKLFGASKDQKFNIKNQ